MAARIKTKTHTFTTSPVTFQDIFAEEYVRFINTIVVRAGTLNTQNITWAAQSETGPAASGGILQAGDAVTMELPGGFVSTDDINWSGTDSDVMYITVIG